MTYGHVRWLRASSAGNALDAPVRAGEFPAVTRPPSPSALSGQEPRLGGRSISRPLNHNKAPESQHLLARPASAMMPSMPATSVTRWKAAVAVVVAATTATMPACAPPVAEPAPTVDPSKCTKDALSTLYPGILTVAADQPAYPPWYKGDNPASGEGFEAALTYAVAAELRYAAEDVRWIRVPFNVALEPGTKPFDASLSQYSITEARKAAVDFSSPYFEVTQAVMTVRSSPAAAVHDLSGLRTVKLGAQVGTTSYTAASSVQGVAGLEVYDTTGEAKRALVEGEIDALVADLPTAFALTNELQDGLMIGQFPRSVDGAEQLGIVLNRGSPLTRCVSWAVDSLRDKGTLGRLQHRWLDEEGSAPVLT